jgi:hypothetical protein
MRYAVIEDGIVVNVIIWDGATEWSPPEGQQVVPSNEAGVGYRYDGAMFHSPDETEE